MYSQAQLKLYTEIGQNFNRYLGSAKNIVEKKTYTSIDSLVWVEVQAYLPQI
jgi:hypothetical protein